ncbi:hypothetical protein N7U49_26865 [Streptomyces sp. AD2-2]|nr:hypothetical protein N7U49_26865 [Streptomyces sp. AD2-2]
MRPEAVHEEVEQAAALVGVAGAGATASMARMPAETSPGRTSARMSPAAAPASRIVAMAARSSWRVCAREIAPASTMASRVSVMPCLVASHSPNRSIHSRSARAGGWQASNSRAPAVSRTTWSW